MEIMNCGKEECFNPVCLKMIRRVAKIVRDWIIEHYGEGYSLSGGCVEASELIVKILHLLGCDDAKTVDGYVRCDDPLEEEEVFKPHVWVEIPCGDEFLYVDVTADQFNFEMYDGHEYAPIILRKRYPYGVTRKGPDEV